MKKIVYLTLLLLLGNFLLKSQNPQQVYSIVKEQKPHSFFVEQAELWWKEIQKNKKNENAWYNYFKANRYARFTYQCKDTTKAYDDKEWLTESIYLKDADEIKTLVGKNIPNTFIYYLIMASDVYDYKQKLEYLEKAYKLEPENSEIYDELIVSYEITSDKNKRSEINNKWFKSNSLSAGILNYNFNVLIGLKQNAVILTSGDNDTFPLWMLQDALGIRPDITVLNLSLVMISDYREKMFDKLGITQLPDSMFLYDNQLTVEYILKNKPVDLTIYIGTTAWLDFTKFEKNLYLEGLVMEYSEQNIDNIAVLINNFENKFALDYIKHNFSYDISNEIVKKMNINYLPGIIKLFEHYKLSGDKEKAEKYKDLGLFIANNSGDEWKDKASEIFK